MKSTTKKDAPVDAKPLDKGEAEGQDARVVILYTVTICPPKWMMGEYLTAIAVHGGLFDQSKAAQIAGVSRSRISQLVLSGRLPLVDVQIELAGTVAPFEQLIPADALLAWMKEPRSKGGRPTHRVNRPELQAA